MFRLSQETVAIVTVGLALAGLDVTSDNAIRSEMQAIRADTAIHPLLVEDAGRSAPASQRVADSRHRAGRALPDACTAASPPHRARSRCNEERICFGLSAEYVQPSAPLRRRIRPGFAPVHSPPRQTCLPLTMTW